MLTFSDTQQLAQWLKIHGIDTTTWDTGQTKTVDDLWVEIMAGESILVEKQPWRQVSVVELAIVSNDQILIEVDQTMGGGRIRQRNRLPSEKKRPGEDTINVVRRCLTEELQIDDVKRVELLDRPISTRQLIEESKSFPGLTTIFTFSRVALTVVGLPKGEFSLPNAAHAFGDPVISHHWRWLSRAEFDNIH